MYRCRSEPPLARRTRYSVPARLAITSSLLPTVIKHESTTTSVACEVDECTHFCYDSPARVASSPGQHVRVRLGSVREAQEQDHWTAEHPHVGEVLPPLALELVRALYKLST